MNQFKKSFRGYRTDEVAQRLSELESQLKASETRCELLEKQLAEARQAADRVQAHLEARDAELEKLRSRYEQQRLERNVKKNQAEAVGRVYIKAFESGREIVMAPSPHVEQFLADIEGATEKAAFEISSAKQDFVDASNKIAAVIADINRQTEFLNRRLEKLAAGVENIRSSYMHFDSVKDATKADIDRIRRSYEQTVSDYKATDSFCTGDEEKSAPERRSDGFPLDPDKKGLTQALLEEESLSSAEAAPEAEMLSNDSAAPAQVLSTETPAAAEATHNDMPNDGASVLGDSPLSDNHQLPVSANAASVQPAADLDGETDEEAELGEKTELNQNAEPGETIERPEEGDTYADFRDEESNSTAEAPFKSSAASDGGTQEQDEKKMRGQNILKLLNKYQKK